MNTSIVPEENRFRTYVVTGSGSIYRLGEELVRASKDVKGLKRALTDEVEQSRTGSSRGAAQAAREKMTAAAAAAAAVSEDAKRRREREAAAAAAEAAAEEERHPTRESPRERKRPLPSLGGGGGGGGGGSAAESGAGAGGGAEEPKKPKHANQYTKAAALAAAAKAAAAGGGGAASGAGKNAGGSPRPMGSGGRAGLDASSGDRPKHPNQHTKAAGMRLLPRASNEPEWHRAATLLKHFPQSPLLPSMIPKLSLCAHLRPSFAVVRSLVWNSRGRCRRGGGSGALVGCWQQQRR